MIVMTTNKPCALPSKAVRFDIRTIPNIPKKPPAPSVRRRMKAAKRRA
jgi:hypothetical protein